TALFAPASPRDTKRRSGNAYSGHPVASRRYDIETMQGGKICRSGAVPARVPDRQDIKHIDKSMP
ncbi:MAG: hypothetical protein ACI9JL_004564, partial [Paracoccaceae bacterium]